MFSLFTPNSWQDLSLQDWECCHPIPCCTSLLFVFSKDDTNTAVPPPPRTCSSPSLSFPFCPTITSPKIWRRKSQVSLLIYCLCARSHVTLHTVHGLTSAWWLLAVTWRFCRLRSNMQTRNRNTPFTRYTRLSNCAFVASTINITLHYIIQRVWQPGVSCKQTSIRFDNQLEWTATVRSTGCQTGLYNRSHNWLYTRYNWLSNWYDNRFDNRLYRVNGA